MFKRITFLEMIGTGSTKHFWFTKRVSQRLLLTDIDFNYTTRYNIDIIVQLFFWCHQLPQK